MSKTEIYELKRLYGARFFDFIEKLRLVVPVLMGVRTSFLLLTKDGMLLFSCKTIMSWMEGAPP